MPTETSFSLLPEELRLQIWSLAYHNSATRVIKFQMQKDVQPTQSPALNIYNVNQEARAKVRHQALKFGHFVTICTPPDSRKGEAGGKGEEGMETVPLYEIICRHGRDVPLITDAGGRHLEVQILLVQTKGRGRAQVRMLVLSSREAKDGSGPCPILGPYPQEKLSGLRRVRSMN